MGTSTRESGDNPSWINGFKHGSVAMYRKHGCKCDICRAGHAARMKKRRDSRTATQPVKGTA